jgi:hypothetical protein
MGRYRAENQNQSDVQIEFQNLLSWADDRLNGSGGRQFLFTAVLQWCTIHGPCEFGDSTDFVSSSAVAE